jgi:hypothetical protein
MIYPEQINNDMVVIYDELLVAIIEQAYHIGPVERFVAKREGRTLPFCTSHS